MRRTDPAWLALLLTLGLLVGCPTPADDDDAGDDDDTGSADDDAGDDDTGPGGIIGGVQIREFQVDSEPPSAMPALWVYGLWDHPFPGQIFGVVAEMMWEPTIEEGDCVFLDQLVLPPCDPPCDVDEYCTASGTCEPWPELRPAGVMTLSGLSAPLTLTPGDGWYALEETLPDDLFDAGDTVTLAAEGDQTPAFEVEVTAVDPLTPALPCDLGLQPGTDLELSWDPPAAASGRIRFEMISMMHAGNGPMVLCDTDDDGSLTVSAAIIDAYLVARTPYETTQLSRYQAATAAVDHGNEVALELGSVRLCYHSP